MVLTAEPGWLGSEYGPTMDMVAELARLGVTPIAGAYVPLSPVEFDELEHRLGAPLPDDYAGYARTFGRAGFATGVIVALPHGPGVGIDVLFGGRVPGRSDDVFTATNALDGVLGRTEVAIGDDLLGNPLVLDSVTGFISSFDFHGGLGRTDVATSFSAMLRVAQPDRIDE